MGSSGTHGIRNGRGRSGRVRRSTMTPSETITNAISVPMLTSVPSVADRREARGERHDDAR